MLDYGSMEIINFNMGFFTVSGIWLFLIIFEGTVFGTYIGKKSNNILWGIVSSALLCVLLIFMGMIFGKVNNSSLVRFEVSEVSTSQNVYPGEDKYPYFKKDGDKLYYYDLIKNRIINDPYEVKKSTEEKFKKLVFNMENQRKDKEEDNADTIK